MVSDGRIDGQFKIERGQGLSQAIRDELGITQADANKLGSVWSKIFEQVDAQQQKNLSEGKAKIYTGGNSLNANASSNYVVQIDQVVRFSKEIWDEIVRLVNEKLGKNIEALEAQDNYQPVSSTSSKGSTSGVSNANVNKEAATTDAEKIKVEVSSEKSAYFREKQEEANAIVKELKAELKSKRVDQSKTKEMLSKITADNVAYVIQAYPEIGKDIDNVFAMGFGFDKDDVYQYVLKPLLERCAEFNPPIEYKVGEKDINVENAKDLSLATMLDLLKKASDAVISRIETSISDDNKICETAQTEFDKANQLLANVANMTPMPKIKDLGVSDEKGSKKYFVILATGESIVAEFSSEGKLQTIGISTDPTVVEGTDNDYCEVVYTATSTEFRQDHTKPERTEVKSTHDWAALGDVIMKIFGSAVSSKED